MRFAYKYPWFRICHTPHHNFPTYVFAKYAAKWGLIPSVHFDEEGADYSREERVMQESKMLMVQGWYARWYDLFLKYKPEILDLFAFDEAVERKAKERLGDTRGVHLGVHVRRGDYKTFQGGRFYYSDEQYVQIIRSYYDCCNPKERLSVYICGNDPNLDKDYYREHLKESPFISQRVILPKTFVCSRCATILLVRPALLRWWPRCITTHRSTG